MSEKSMRVLQHFFRMLVDENTRLLDSTCGSGNAVRIAEEMGAHSVLGLEIDPDFCQLAQKAYVRGKDTTIAELLGEDGSAETAARI
jgi:predicted RNA methylase